MNEVLRYEDQVDLAIRGLRESEAIEHPTRWKNWDLWDFLTTITRSTPLDAEILDVGCASNPLLRNLAACGYKNLHGIDFDVSKEKPHKNIKLRAGDLTHTDYHYQQFDIVTSLSVVEHGVDFEKYFAEMNRILKPGGLLLTSTDFWYRKIDTRRVPKRKTFGLPWTILDANDVIRFLEISRRWGFEQISALNLTAEDKVVKWGGKEYTFISIGLRKVAS